MKIVGITLSKKLTKENGIKSYEIKDSYIKYVNKAGFLPILIPYLDEEEKIRDLLNKLDILILSGGIDIAPFRYGENPSIYCQDFDFLRDESEFKIRKIARDINIPTLAICRGFQLVNILYGGFLYQDLSQLNDNSVIHRHGEEEEISYHYVKIKRSKLLNILGFSKEEKIIVNSNHHQGIKDLGQGLTPSAYSDDGLIEAFESNTWNMIGLQWHPEDMDKDTMVKIIEYLGGNI